MVGPRCSLGLLCVGPTNGTKRCSRPGTQNEHCDGLYHHCDVGFKCFRNQCVVPSATGSLCGENEPCADGLTCIRGVCREPMDDLRCDGLTRTCKDGMVCALGFCRELRAENQEAPWLTPVTAPIFVSKTSV